VPSHAATVCFCSRSPNPRTYQLLNDFASRAGGSGHNPVLLELRGILGGESWLWVGSAFVPAEHVAFRSPAHCQLQPYLHTVPAELACFRALLQGFGVRDSFGPGDFVHVLQRMAAETVVPGAVERRPLDAGRVSMAISMAQLLSDEAMQAQDLELFVPDALGRLALPSELVCDDAPWMSKKGEGLRFVHPKIAMAVGSKLGVRSLRMLLLAQTSETDSLGFELPSEAFGQAESLTRRLRHILELYPEGPSILSELIQVGESAVV
jgi:sacsin